MVQFMTNDIVVSEVKGKVAWIYLNRLDKYNAINREMVEKLIYYLKRYEQQKGVVTIAITSKGKVFSAGLDLTELSSIKNVEDSHKIFYERLYTLVKEMVNLSKPIIIVVNGLAIGGAFEILYGADIIIATKEAKFSIAEARWGFIPPISVILGSQLMGLQNASRLVMTTDTINAEEAKSLGIVSNVVDQNEVEKIVEEYAEKLSNSSPEAIMEIKRIMSRIKLNPMVEWAFEVLVRLAGKEDHVENIKRFVSEKKMPKWDW